MDKNDAEAYVAECVEAIRGIVEKDMDDDLETTALLLKQFSYLSPKFLELPEVLAWGERNNIEVFSLIVKGD